LRRPGSPCRAPSPLGRLPSATFPNSTPLLMPAYLSPDSPPVLQVVVHNLPWTCTWQSLKDYFRDWKVERADIVEDQWGRSR
jgi:hypothetical protein